MEKVLKRSLSIFLAITIIFSSALVGLAEIDFGKLDFGEIDFSGVSRFMKELTPDFYVKSKAADSGTCGTNVNWSLSNGKLTISGTGDMTDYTSSTDVPWEPSRTSIETIVIKDGVTSIGQLAFCYCTNLTTITIPDSVTKIGDNAFSNCTKLITVTISDKVTNLVWGAFSDCDSLESINVDSSNPNYSSASGVLFNKDKTKLIQYPAGKKTTKYTIPGSVTKIYDSSFDKCRNLLTVKIPASVISVTAYAFFECYSLTSISVDVNNTNYSSSGGALFNKDKTTLIKYPNGRKSSIYAIPDSVMTIGDSAFRGCKIPTTVTIPNSVRSIGSSAFEGCENLTTITIPNSVTSIGSHTFYRCSNLTTATIPNSVTSIGSYAFWECSSLKTLTIPYSVRSIGSYAFMDCPSLTTVTIQNGVTSIGNSAFENCTSLLTIKIPDSVTSIGKEAFLNTKYYNTANKWDIDVLYIGNHLIKAKTSLSGVYEIKEGTKTISESAFSSCSKMSSVIIPEGVKAILDGTFKGCSNLVSITIPKSLESIASNAFGSMLLSSPIDDVYYEGTIEQWELFESKQDFSRNPFGKAEIHYNSNKYDVTYNVVSDDGTWFHIYNKEVWWESELNNIYEGKKLHSAVKNVTVEHNGVCEEFSSNGFFVEKANLAYATTITANGFQKYIIPKAVAKSFKDDSVYNFSVYMTKDRKDGETYISSVFARNSGDSKRAYIDVTTENLNLLSGVKSTVIITAVEQGSPVKEYWLSQDEQHKIQDNKDGINDGVFDEYDLYSVFDANKPVYAYAVLENGKTTEPVSLSLNKAIMSDAAAAFLNYCDSSTVSLMGKDGFKITISDDVPLVGGAEFTAGLCSFPIGVEIQNERVRISLGIDIFKNEVNGKDDTEWFNFKDACKNINEAVEETTEKMKTMRNLLIASKFGAFEPEKKKNFDGSFLGYIEAYIVNGEIVFKEVSGTLALEFFFNYKQQFLVVGVPAIYAYVKAGAEASLELSSGRPVVDKNFPFVFDAELNITPSLKVGGGVGVKDAISAGFWGKGSAPLGVSFTDKHLTWGLKGEIGLEAEFFILNGDVTLLEGSVDIIDHYFGSSEKSLSWQTDIMYSGNTIDVFKDGEVSLADRSYLENTSEWLGGQSSSTYSLRRAITPESVKISDLQTSVYKNSQTQLVQFGDTMLMAWIEDCADRDAYNRMRLVYSVYDTETGAWKEPQAVADNGTSDAAPSLATDGENVYIAWQNIDYTISTADTETVNLLMENAEIRLAKYNTETGCFENAITVTDNATYDYAPKVTVNNGIAEVYWVNSSSLDFDAGTLSICKSDFYGSTETVLSGLNYIHSVDSNGTDISYTMDKDGDTSTTTDVKVYTNSEQVSVDYEGVETSCLYSTYAMLDGKKTLFYVDDYNLCYIQDGEEKVVFEIPRNINGNLQICSDGNETTAMWLEAGEIGTDLYTCSYENGEWTAPVQLTSFSKVLSNVALTYFNSKIYGVFNRTHLVEKTSEVDGSIYFKNGETDLCQLTTEGFSDVSLSLMEVDESQFICGEDATFTVFVNNNGTEKITDISFDITDGNGYAQTITKTLDLASGASELVELTYTVPESISQTELSVYAFVNGDVNDEDNIISTDIGTPDLTVGDLSVKFINGVYIVSGIVSNKNNVAAENVKASAVLGDSSEGNYIVENIGTIEPRGKRNIEFLISTDLMDFTANSFYDGTITITSDTNERITNNNESVVCITKPNVHLHSNEDWVVDKEVTCTEDGLRHKTCSDCGETITEVVPAPGHDYSEEWIIDEEVTCTTDGSKSHHCSMCDSKSEVTIITAQGHDYSSEWTIDEEATCTDSGSKSHHCNVCGEQTDVTVIEAMGHDYSEEWTIDVAATCTTTGIKSHHCSMCDSKADETIIDVAGHIFVYEACQICGALYNGNCTDTLTHSFTNYIYDENATETDSGTITAYCDNDCRSRRTLDNINITTNNDTKTIYISGTGRLTRTHIEVFVESIASVEGVVIAEGVSAIDKYTFDSFYNLKTIEIPDTISSVGDYAFRNCSSIRCIVFPESIDSFGKCVLQGCSNLEKLTIPFIGSSYSDSTSGSSTQLLGYIFGDIEYENSVSVKQQYNVLLSKTYYLPLTLSEVIVLGGTLSYGAFYNCSSIENIVLGQNVTYIGSQAFCGCTNLASITLHNCVTNVGSSAFKNCNSLKYVFYTGAESDWPSITIGSGNTQLTDAAIHYNSTDHNYELAEALSVHPHTISYKCSSCDSTKTKMPIVSDCIQCIYGTDTPIKETGNTEIDFDNLLIFTDVKNSNDISEFLSLSESAIVVSTASSVYDDCEFYGTGTIVSVFDGNNHIGDFTLIVEGDLNGDSICDVLDAAQSQRYSAGFDTPSDNEIYAANGCVSDEIDVVSYQNVVNTCLIS